MTVTKPIVFIVDDDAGIRRSLPILLATAELETRCFASAAEFLAAFDPTQAGCLLLDVRMPGMSGTALQEELTRRQARLPVVFMTGYADLPVGVAAMKLGAVDFLTKPVNGQQLLHCVQAALDRDRERRLAEATRLGFETRLRKLTAREREVLVLALAGGENRDIATRLGISQRTVEGHRARIYLKTGFNSLLDLARQAGEAGLKPADLAPRGDPPTP